jgi:dTDP-glucose 4,6-dehydratase/UDP-glucose 4-epimerase
MTENKILIIGSNGFIGSNAEKFFSKRGYDVYSSDIQNSINKKYFKFDSNNPNFEILFNSIKFDFCINATGAANVSNSFNNPLIDFNLNVFNVIKILDAIRLYNPTCKFINFSSAAVYGNPILLPIKEDDTLQPISPYGFHKMYSEKICEEYYKLFQIKTVSLRLFSVFGENLKKQIFWDLYTKVIETNNDLITLNGEGNESRDFIYIFDFIMHLKN